MKASTLVAQSLRFHWRTHLGVLLGATLATAILVGALAVGDSVRASLRGMALSRLGSVQFVLNSQSRFFRLELADAIAKELNAPVAPVILLRGTAGNGDTRAGRVQVVGVDDRFWPLAPNEKDEIGRMKDESHPNSSFILHPSSFQDSVVLNERLAAVLGVKAGDEILLRVDKPSLLSRDAPLSTVTDASVALRLPVASVVGDDAFGHFGLDANQIPPLNAFLPIDLLQRKLGLEGRANVLLVGAREGKPLSPADATGALWKRWQFADAGLELRQLPGQETLELRTERVFLDPPVGEAAQKATPEAQGVLTYFVNELRVGERTTPYSTVAALQSSLLPQDMKPDEILINRWLADDLQAKVGDRLTLKYWVVGPMRKLTEQTGDFRIRAILPLEGAARDPDLMPPIPGLADKKDCRDWEPGVPIDLKKIRDKDQRYWTLYRGTPKAFLTLQAGRKIWNNRFGDLTAVRFPMVAPALTPQPPLPRTGEGEKTSRPPALHPEVKGVGKEGRDAIEAKLRQAINPASLGLFFVPVREQALAATSPSLDFGGLFLGFSLFLIVAAVLLTALLFALGVEQRAEEVGILLAVGWTPRRVQRLLLAEGAALALAAGVIGSVLGVFYTKATIYGLSTVWKGAVANSTLHYHAEPMTVVMGALAGFLVGLLAIWLVTRKQARVPARELLARGAESESRLLATAGSSRRRGSPALFVALVAVIGAVAMVATAPAGDPEKAATSFFGAGALLLIGGLMACHALISRSARGAVERLSIGLLGVRNSARRLGRSLSAIGLLACGSFLVIAVGANRHDVREGAGRRTSGTGGFALYGEATLPVYQDLNTPEGRDAFGLEADDLRDVSIVALRLREGDEASCLNLNRAQAPSLLGVPPEVFRKRGAFTFVQTLPAQKGAEDPWSLLERPSDDGAIPVIGDMNTVAWSLGKGLGDTLPYVDDRGNVLKLRIVGVLANSILQGHFVLSEANFIKYFPTQSGYQVFLMDVPAGREVAVTRTLTHAMEDIGLTLTSTSQRLADFNTVENTYLSIFAMLGGLGLLLGSLGLGVVVLRNVLERRGELALLRAVGYRVRSLHWLVFSEHALLLSLGLAVGVLSALVAVLPALRSPGTETPIASLALTLAAVLVSGFFWVWSATALALRGPLLAALRNE